MSTIPVSGEKTVSDDPAPGFPQPKRVQHDVTQNDAAQHHSSKVNGLGMWSAWERNFSNKLKACLDLVDNAVDAALWDSDDEDDEEEGDNSTGERPEKALTQMEKWKRQSGRISISTESHRLAMYNYHDSSNGDDDDDENGNGSNATENPNSGEKPSAAKSPPLILHDILGNGGVGRRETSANKNANDNGNVKSENSNNSDNVDFVLIDDENTMCLHNDCVHPVKELRKILDVYNSAKSDSDIGENGVGVKQAAAAMSDLSMVVTSRIDEEPLMMDYGDNDDDDNSTPRIRKCLISIGILWRKFQTTENCVIPSWTLPIEFYIDEHNERKKKEQGDGGAEVKGIGDFLGETCKPVLLRELANVTANNKLLGAAMKEYGAAAPSNRRKYGIQRLAKHIELMISTPSKKNGKKQAKPPHPHQYLMILHKFGKHRKKGTEDGSKDERKSLIMKSRDELDDLLRDLADEMPKTYLHIPPAPFFRVKVNQETLNFQYWERHLVELHQIPLLIDRKNDFRTAEDWLIPQSDDCYEVKVSLGFDPRRVNSKGVSNSFIGGQACSLLIFSRISGRLFLKHDDARGVLRLTNSGTNFCQGLTVIVDDYEGHLPLTPTKESLAFGLEDYGKIHERNLYAWLGALANVYWQHFFSMFKTKTALGNAVKAQMHRVDALERERSRNLPTLRDGSFSSVEKICFSRERVKDSIRPFKSDDTKWTSGPDTLIKLREPRAPKPKKKVSPKKSTPSQSNVPEEDDYDSDGNDLMVGAPPSSLFDSVVKPVVNGEPLRERLDGRPVRASMKPQRFDEILDKPKSKTRKKRLKSTTDDDNSDGIRLKKKLKDVRSKLKATQLELIASKTVCDDLQMQLEEKGEAKINESGEILKLKGQLTKAEAKHQEELEGLKRDHANKLREMMARIRELEGQTHEFTM